MFGILVRRASSFQFNVITFFLFVYFSILSGHFYFEIKNNVEVKKISSAYHSSMDFIAVCLCNVRCFSVTVLLIEIAFNFHV